MTELREASNILAENLILVPSVGLETEEINFLTIGCTLGAWGKLSRGPHFV